MRISTQQMYFSTLNSMVSQQVALSKTQVQVATGKRIRTPADDPIASSALLDLTQSVSVADQYQRAAEAAKNRLTLEDGALSQVQDALQRVHELVLQTGSTILSNNDRLQISEEAQQILDRLLAVANTTDTNGDYLFAGYQSSVAPFSRNGSGTYDYNGDDGQRAAQIGPSLFVNDGDSGTAVFRNIKNGNGTFQTIEGGNVLTPGPNLGGAVIDPGSVQGTFIPDTYTLAFTQVPASSPATYTYTVTDSSATVIAGPTAYTDGAEIDLSAVGIKTSIRGTPADGDTFTLRPSTNQDLLQTVQNFVDNLRTGFNDAAGQAAFENALNRVGVDLAGAMSNVLGIQVQIGARLNSMDVQISNNESYTDYLKEAKSDIEDLDLTEAISRMNQQMTGLQAAQQSFVRIQNLSLFEMLK